METKQVGSKLLTCIQEVPISDLGQDTDYNESRFHDFPHSLQAKARRVPLTSA
jgi:hypothetical protein